MYSRMLQLCLAVIFLVFTFTFADEKPEAKVYGNGITIEEVTKISEILANPDAYIGKSVMVEGRIVDACEKRGCWMALAGDKEFETLRIKVNDGEIVFPFTAKGKLARAQGEFMKIELTKEQTINYLQHHAEEHGTEFDPESVTEGMTYYQIKGTGALIYE